MASNRKRTSDDDVVADTPEKVAKAVLNDTVLYADVLSQNLPTQVAGVSGDELDFNQAILMVIK